MLKYLEINLFHIDQLLFHLFQMVSSEISNILKSEDVMHTINAFKNMGVKIE